MFEIPRKRHKGRYYTGACWAPTFSAGPAFCMAVTDVAESQEWRTELARSGYGARIGRAQIGRG